MTDIINILPDSVANQIAAGEVVDRPASAVKELLENAMDAGATEIQLVVKDAGRTLMQVIDNGCGMSETDARLCFERHATSKIRNADDLFALHTMGFRGEALASIAAVAQVELKTRPHDSQLGTQVTVEGSAVKDQQPCNCSAGTSIAVKNLFFNIPARRNFLKKESIELAHIEEIFKRIAIANYKVAFTFHHNGRLLYDLKGGNFAQRIAGIFGNTFKERLYPVEEQTEPVKIKGYVGKAEYVKRTRGDQYLFVNSRFIKHPGLSSAIEKAYRELIPEHTYPSYVIMMDVDPSRIDVNIHPTKTEVRFLDEQVIYAILRAATKKALGQFSLASELDFNPSTEIDFTPAAKGHIPETPRIEYNPHYNPFSATSHTPSSTFTPPKRDFSLPLADSTELAEPTPAKLTPVTPMSYLNRYIVTTLKSGIVVIDRQRAQERIIYEQMLRRRQNAQPDAQRLMFPVNCTFSAADSELMNELLTPLRELGFIIEPLGRNTFVVTATPQGVRDSDLQSILDQTISEYKSSMMERFNDRDKSVSLSLARQISSHASKEMKPEEMQHLIADLFSCQAPDTSPSGKKIMFILNEQDLAERLK